MKKILLLLLLFSFPIFSAPLFSQSQITGAPFNVRIDQIDSRDFPYLGVYISAASTNGEPILSLMKNNFNLFVDGQQLKSEIEISGFQYTGEGISYSIIISSNGVMEGEPLEQQIRAATFLVESLRDQDRLSVYNFGEEVKPIFEFQKKSESLTEKIGKIEAIGANPHFFDALVYVARRTEYAEQKRKVIIMLSDGRESGSRYTKEQLFGVLDESSIPVYALGIKLMEGMNLYRLSSVSEHSGGGYIYAGESTNLTRGMDLIIKQILLGYRLEFKVREINADNLPHQLQVKAQYYGKMSQFFKNFKATKVPLPLWLLIVLIVIVIIILAVIVLALLIYRKKKRQAMGITKRKCDKCGQRMKDDWDECPFCKYLPQKKTGFKFFNKEKA